MSAHTAPVLVGPADIKYSRRALARLALSAAAQELADSAAAAVPTTSDAYGTAFEDVDFACRLVTSAREVLRCAVVFAYERSRDWDEIGDALDLPTDKATGETVADKARAAYGEDITRWEDALNRPFEPSGPFVSSRLPSGLSDPDFTIQYLDEWCLKHLEPSSATRSNAESAGEVERMVSANLPQHTALTEMNREARYAHCLFMNRVPSGAPEYAAFRERKAEVFARAEQENKNAEVERQARSLVELRNMTLNELSRTTGLQWKRYTPRDCSSRYLVALDGRHIGDVEPATTQYDSGRKRVLSWRAISCGSDTHSDKKSVKAAAEALAARAALPTPESQ